MSTLKSRVKVDFSGTYLAEDAGLGRATVDVGPVWALAFEDGVGVGEADSIYSLKDQEIASGGALTLDLKGALVDALGAPFTPAKLRAVCIVAHRSNTTILTLFGDAASVPVLSNPATTRALAAGGIFLVVDRSAAGIPVTAGTGDIIKIANAAGAAAKVDLVLIGTSS